MTYCLGVKVESGFIGIADTRITSGTQTAKAKKVYLVNRPGQSFFIMTSGLRSVRDKALTYFEELLEEAKTFQDYNKLYKAVNAFSEQVKRVAREDKKSLTEAGLTFNLFSIIGGQFHGDKEHKLYLLYPEGNWVEVSEGSPFAIIGNNGYGKPILDRAIRYRSSLRFALKAGFLSFDATRISANDVDFPIDVLLYEKDSFQIREQRFKRKDMQVLSKHWNSALSYYIQEMPGEWVDGLIRPPELDEESE